MFQVHEISDSIGYYFAGFVDGEGSFHLTFRKRKDYVHPWKVSLSLNVSQKEKAILALFKRHLQCGKLRPKGGGVWMFEVSNLTAIRENVIPFFRKYGFLSAKKKRDFAIFRQMAELMNGGAHLRKAGIVELLKLRREMNDGGKRKYSEEEILMAWPAEESSETICRTSPETNVGEDDIVRSSGRPEEAGGNDQPA
jgi:LAGLIDADG endonuclease